MELGMTSSVTNKSTTPKEAQQVIYLSWKEGVLFQYGTKPFPLGQCKPRLSTVLHRKNPHH